MAPRKLSAPLALTLTLLAAPAHALEVEDAVTPEPPPGAPVAAGYMEIHNPDSDPVTITGVSSPDFDTVELHETETDDDGSASMVELDDLEVPPRGVVSLVPRGRHVMIYLDDDDEIAKGDRIPIVLETDDGDVTVELEVVDRSEIEAD